MINHHVINEFIYLFGIYLFDKIIFFIYLGNNYAKIMFKMTK